MLNVRSLIEDSLQFYDRVYTVACSRQLFFALRKLLLFIVTLMLLSMPVLQAAHALSHLSPDNTTLVDEDPDGKDREPICGECLVLTTLLVFICVFAALFFPPRRSLRLSYLSRRCTPGDLPLPYSTRAPPLA